MFNNPHLQTLADKMKTERMDENEKLLADAAFGIAYFVLDVLASLEEAVSEIATAAKEIAEHLHPDAGK